MKKKKKRHGLGGCPSNHCSGGSHARQSQITDGQLDCLFGNAETIARKNRTSTYRCSYCGCVYVGFESPEILGYLNSAIHGEGWHPN